MNKIGEHATVIGASMAGLLTARILADHFEQVTVLERDTFPPPGEQRKGVPQGRHAHGLLATGREVIEELFPGITQELVAQGVVPYDATARMRRCIAGAYHCRFPSGIVSLAVSRPCLEAQVRTRLLALPNVRVIQQCDVVGLTASADRSTITGVRLLRRAPGSAEETLSADLVVDAGGRGSRTPAWLESLGYPTPEEERVRIGMTYTSRLYRRRPEHLGGDLGVFVAATPESKRAGALLAQEGERWILSLGGYFDEYAPTDEQGFLEYARSLPAPDIYNVIKDAEPLSEPVTYRFPANMRRHYEGLTRFPKGLLVIGDALCGFNPTYGQGMTVAALEVRALQQCLTGGTDRLAERFFRQASTVVSVAWAITVGGDLRIPEVEGPRTRMGRFLNWYLGRLHIAAQHDPVVALAFSKVANLAAAPPSILRPRVALRVLWGNLRPANRAASTETAPAPVLSQG